MKFGIVIKHERRNIRLQVELVTDHGAMAKYRVTARNGAYVLQTNLPLLKAKGLKFKPPTWKIVQGGELRITLLDLITKEIEKHEPV